MNDNNTPEIETLPLWDDEYTLFDVPGQADETKPAESLTGPRSSTTRPKRAKKPDQINLFAVLLEDDPEPNLRLDIYVTDKTSHISDDDMDRKFMDQGNCVVPRGLDKERRQRMLNEVDAALFPYYDETTPPNWTAGRELCEGCPIMQQCLRYAVAEGIEDGMYGGLTPAERELWRKQKLAPENVTHGTRSCYNTGCRCEPCNEANNKYMSRFRRQDQDAYDVA